MQWSTVYFWPQGWIWGEAHNKNEEGHKLMHGYSRPVKFLTLGINSGEDRPSS